jgi:RHS repeat-associated protein
MWCGPQGGTPEKLLEVTQTLVEERTQMIFVSSPNSNVRYDNVAFNVADPETADLTYNDANELVTMNLNGVETHFTYDDWGRTASKYVGDGSVLHAEYGYRYGDKLKQVFSTFPGEEDEVHFIHDGLGKRRMKQVHADAAQDMEREWYRYDAGWNVVGQYADDPASFWDIGGLESSAVWHGMTPLAEVTGSTPNGAYRHATHDHLGSTRSLFDASKNAVGAIEYTPYGLPLVTAGVMPEYTFTGKPFDAETGMYHFPFRQYSPVTARWLTRDPLGMVDGPNVYGYVGGSPVAFTDPTGQFTFTAACCVACSFFVAWDIYDVLTDPLTCTGLSGAEWAKCAVGEVIKKVAGEDSCIKAAILTADSAEDMLDAATDCFKCDLLDSLRDAGKALSCFCCMAKAFEWIISKIPIPGPGPVDLPIPG